MTAMVFYAISCDVKLAGLCLYEPGGVVDFHGIIDVCDMSECMILKQVMSWTQGTQASESDPTFSTAKTMNT